MIDRAIQGDELFAAVHALARRGQKGRGRGAGSGGASGAAVEEKSLTIEGHPLLLKEIPYCRGKSLTVKTNPLLYKALGGLAAAAVAAAAARCADFL